MWTLTRLWACVSCKWTSLLRIMKLSGSESIWICWNLLSSQSNVKLTWPSPINRSALFHFEFVLVNLHRPHKVNTDLFEWFGPLFSTKAIWILTLNLISSGRPAQWQSRYGRTKQKQRSNSAPAGTRQSLNFDMWRNTNTGIHPPTYTVNTKTFNQSKVETQAHTTSTQMSSLIFHPTFQLVFITSAVGENLLQTTCVYIYLHVL